MLNFKVIGTGSTGNAVLIGKVLIDCGVSYKALKSEDFKLVLLTHIHGDHFKRSTIKALAEDRPMLRWGVPPYLVSDVVDCGVDLKRIDILEDKTVTYNLNETVTIKPLVLIHDVPNTGYYINYGGKRVVYITDTGTVDHLNDLIDCDLYLIEANYRQAELEERIREKRKRGEFTYEERVADTHLSYEQACRFLEKNASPDSYVRFLHEHVNR